MAQTKAIELLYSLQEKVGKEEGRKIVEAFSEGLEAMEERAGALALQKKLELKDELTKELASKADLKAVEARLEGKIDVVKKELEGKIDLVRQEMQTIKTELEVKIAKLDQKFNFMIVLMIIALTLMNPVAAELIKKALRV